MTNEQLIRAIQDALNTEETGEALVEVARNACRAEQELANIVARQRAADASGWRFDAPGWRFDAPGWRF